MRPGPRYAAAALGAAALAAGAWLLLAGAPEIDRSPERSSAARPESAARTRASAGQGSDPGAASPSARGADSAELEVAEDGALLIRVAASAKPVAGADVRLFWRPAGQRGGSGWAQTPGGRSGADGLLRLPARPGSYLVSARAEGFAPGHAEAIHPSGGAQTRVEVRLTAAAALSGRTVDAATKEPLPLAEVVLSPQLRGGPRGRAPIPDELRVSTYSDKRGNFRFAGVAPGRWALEARAPSYAPARLREVVVPRSDLTVALEAAATVEGTVFLDGKPAAGAAIAVSGAAEVASAESGPQGGYSAQVMPGTHHVTATLGESAGAARGPVTVAAGGTARGVDIELGPSASIGGRVRDAAGPVAGAAVEATPHREVGSASRAATAAEGAYELRGLSPGSYDVEVAAPGHARAIASGITVRRGERFPLDVLLSDLTAVEGVVRLGSGTPAGGAVVSVMDAGGRGPGRGRGDRGAPQETLTDVEGHYRVEGVSPGRALVSARKDDGSPAASQAVSVSAGETARADLVLLEGGLVAGTVVDSKSLPVPGALVFALDPSGRGFGGFGGGAGRTATADDVGAFLMPLPAGSFNLSAARPSASAAQGPAWGGRPPILATVTVEVGRRADAVLALPDGPPSPLAGLVLEPAGSPSPGAMVRASSTASGAQWVTAAGDGSFSLNVSPDAPVDLTARNGGRVGSASAAAGAGQVTVQLQPGASLQGRLLGDPAPETFSAVANTQGVGIPWGGGPPGSSDQQFTGDAFELGDVAPGQVSVNVKTSDGRIGSAQLSVGAGEVGKVDVQLSPAVTLTGRAVSAGTSQPIARARTLVDGVAGRRGVAGADGRFSRTVAVGHHQLVVSAAGYSTVTLPVDAAAQPAAVDLGDVALTPTGADPGTVGATFSGVGPVLVASVTPGGPAAQAGLAAGDAVVSIDGAPPATAADADARSKGAPGTPAVFSLRRSGAAVTATVVRAQ